MEEPRKLSCYALAIVRCLAEGGDGKKYFDRLHGWPHHQQQAKDYGWLTTAGELTPLGRRVGQELMAAGIPEGASWNHGDKYRTAAATALGITPVLEREEMEHVRATLTTEGPGAKLPTGPVWGTKAQPVDAKPKQRAKPGNPSGVKNGDGPPVDSPPDYFGAFTAPGAATISTGGGTKAGSKQRTGKARKAPA